jgi:hypothetical protein
MSCPMDRITRIRTTTPSPYPTAIFVDNHDTKTFRFSLPANATFDLFLDDHLHFHALVPPEYCGVFRSHRGTLRNRRHIPSICMTSVWATLC